MPQCCAVNCNTKPEKGSKFFSLPFGKGDEARLKIWIHRIGRKDWFPNRNSRLCERHFTEEEFEKNRQDGLRKLKPNALPSIFSHRPLQPTRKPPAKRKKINSETLEANTSFFEDAAEMCLSENNKQDSGYCAVIDTAIIDNIYPRELVGFPITQEDTPKESIVDLKRKVELLQKQLRVSKEETKKLSDGIRQILNEDQITCMQKGTMRGFTWSSETIQKSLRIRLACGSKGYDLLREMGQPIPGERTLRRRLECVKFQPGILHELLPSLKLKVDSMRKEERHASIMIDEMSLTSALEYDSSNDCVIGQPTIPSSNQHLELVATHALVFMLGGLSSRWKQTIGFHFTGNSFCAKTVKKFLWELIIKLEAIGLKIDVIISDMGGNNQALWRECGIVVGRYSQTKNYCLHPCEADRQLYFMPDAPHIIKNLRNYITGNQEIEIPPKFVKKYQLCSNIVSISPIKKLLEIDQELDLKLSPHLRESVIAPSHFEKMKVGLACAFFSTEVAAAIAYAVEKRKLDKSALTTAWFIKTVHRWFKLATSRNRKMALSFVVKDKHSEAVEYLQEVRELFETLKVGKKGSWKPVQSGVVLATKTILDLQAYLLIDMKFEFVLCCRLAQDALENLFSLIRSVNPIPSPKSFKTALRLITIAQFLRPVQNGNYDIDDCEYLVNFLEEKKMVGEKRNEVCEIGLTENYSNEEDHVDENSFPCNADIRLSGEENRLHNDDELQSLFHFCGRTVREVRRKYKLCSECQSFLARNKLDYAEYKDMQRLTELKSYANTQNMTVDPLVYCSDAVFTLLKQTEESFRSMEMEIMSSSCTVANLSKMVSDRCINLEFPTCCNVQEKMLNVFIKSRIYLLLRKKTSELPRTNSAKCGSRSEGMRHALKNVR